MLIRTDRQFLAHIGDLIRLAPFGGTTHGLGEIGVILLDHRDHVRRHAVCSSQIEIATGFVEHIDEAGLGTGKLGRLGHDSVQHGVGIEGGIDRLSDGAESAKLLPRTD